MDPAIEIRVGAGLGDYFKFGDEIAEAFNKGKLLEELKIVGKVALINQLQELALGRIKQLNFRLFFNVIVKTFISGKLGMTKPDSNAQAITSQIIDIPLDAMIMGYNPKLDIVAAQILGTYMGNKLGALAQQKIADYRNAHQISVDETKGYVVQTKTIANTKKPDSTATFKPQTKASPAAQVADNAEDGSSLRFLNENLLRNGVEEAVANAFRIPLNSQSYFNPAGDEKPPTVSSPGLNIAKNIGVGALYFGKGLAEGAWNTIKGIGSLAWDLSFNPFRPVVNLSTGLYRTTMFLGKNVGPFLYDGIILMNDSFGRYPPYSTREMAELLYQMEISPRVASAGERMTQRFAPFVEYLQNADANTISEAAGKLAGEFVVPAFAAKGLSKLGIFAGKTEVVSEALDWSRSGKNSVNAAEHVIQSHGNLRLDKPIQGVFYGDPIKVTEEAWKTAKVNDIKPVTIDRKDYYVIPRSGAGFEGGMGGQLQTNNHITIITEPGTNKVITAFPSGATMRFPKDYQFLLEQEVIHDRILYR